MLPATPPAILLATLNAKYIHASLGLRYLRANMGELRELTALKEYTIARPAEEVVADLLQILGEAAPGAPAPIVGFGVYIWNVGQTARVLAGLRAARPDIRIVLGGPEVSHEVEDQAITALADHVITGWGDLSFAELCRALRAGQPMPRIIPGRQPPLEQLALPYGEYSDTDLAQRLLYVEASRGCPFKCEFCLSALDKTAWSFELERFLAAMEGLYQRGARHFKFVDRTFNLKVESSRRILQFFLDKLEADGAGELFLHFEVVPDHLPEGLREMIVRFPPGVLQFEVGIQSLNEAVQQRISRRQDNLRAAANLRWLVESSPAHIHADLIFGLPGEDLASFAVGFDQLYALGPHEIQLGILKRLRGTPIIRHTADYAMEYDPEPPYTVRQTGAVDGATLASFSRFARYWDMVANSGRFQQTLPLLLGASASPFQAFWDFSVWLWQSTRKTSGLSPEALVDALFDYLSGPLAQSPKTVRARLLADYLASGARSKPRALADILPSIPPVPRQSRKLAERQAQHQGQHQAPRHAQSG